MINLPTNRLLIPGLLAGMLILSGCSTSSMKSQSGDGMMQEPMMDAMEKSMDDKSMDKTMHDSMEKPMMDSMDKPMMKPMKEDTM